MEWFNGRWWPTKDGDPRAFALMRRHYSFNAYADNRRQDLTYRNRHLFAGPGEAIVLLTLDCKALFVWRKFIDASGQTGINCAVFHNEGPHLSSSLILEAEQLAWAKWPGERLYTYVDPAQVSANPGYCFKKAGWRKLPQTTKVNGLHILEKQPE